MKEPSFFAKILLFGEYGIIENAKGLTVPLNFYKGTLKFDDDKSFRESTESLLSFAKHLQTNMPDQFDTERLFHDLENHMYFDSDIPQGYGVGSSGALVAAIYDKYAINPISKNKLEKNQISELKKTFGEMESYFHGTSSGIDPLICYLNIPLLINSKNDIDTVGLPHEKEGKGAVFLINSGTPGKTGPMVQMFFEKMKHEGFRKTLHREFTKYNDACIDAFVKGNTEPLFTNLKDLSRWAFVNFKPMIPQRLLQAWENGIQTNDYYLKLCGSGGGGYVLGFTQDFEKAKTALPDFQLKPVYRF
ncbi:mevalonate kinase [Flavobacteriaceae bacterium Ap0902]|nr:mevalonate kinase [Flavobacteriaceae bacterium Ap0902]